MPILRPFRALRFDTAATDLSAVLCPPYDIIAPWQRLELLARHPHNAVRIELPADLGQADEAAYRGAARTVAEWRSNGVLRKDRVPSLTFHRMSWRSADGEERSAAGVFARARLEAFGPGSGILPHERTLGGPKEDRYALLRATGLNTSPIVMLAGADDEPASSEASDRPARPSLTGLSSLVDACTSGPPDAVAAADDVRHELWIRPARDPGRDGRGVEDDPVDGPGIADAGEDLLARLAAGPLTIADGHHRYETALRYRDERGRNRACESDPAWDYVMALVYPLEGSPPALATHRVMRDGPVGPALLEAVEPLATVEPLGSADDLLDRMSHAPRLGVGASGSGRISVLSGPTAAILRVRPAAIAERLGQGYSDASLGLDVNALGVIIETVWGRDAATLANERRLAYVKEPGEAVEIVRRGEAAVAFLLDPVPAGAIARVARAGELMPQKSTYFHPKAPTGLLFSPLEW